MKLSHEATTRLDALLRAFLSPLANAISSIIIIILIGIKGSFGVRPIDASQYRFLKAGNA